VTISPNTQSHRAPSRSPDQSSLVEAARSIPLLWSEQRLAPSQSLRVTDPLSYHTMRICSIPEGNGAAGNSGRRTSVHESGTVSWLRKMRRAAGRQDAYAARRKSFSVRRDLIGRVSTRADVRHFNIREDSFSSWAKVVDCGDTPFTYLVRTTKKNLLSAWSYGCYGNFQGQYGRIEAVG